MLVVAAIDLTNRPAILKPLLLTFHNESAGAELVLSRRIIS